MDQALTLLYSRHSKDCLPIILSEVKNLNRYEVLSIFYYAFLNFCDRVPTGEFQYRNDASFTGYFKTACVNQARKFRREYALPAFILPSEMLEVMKDDVNEAEELAEQDFLEDKKNRYAIELKFEEDNKFDLLDEVVRVFHAMNDKCKFLLVLKFFLNLSHREIADALRLFYEIKNENVSKSELYRCLDYIKARVRMPAD